jgi:hypothetical protein
MAFPGTLNINYYRGDTYEFILYPKKANGTAFDLSNYSNNQSPKFQIAPSRGAAGFADQVEAQAIISDDGLSLLCRIAPGAGIQLVAGTTYVYDVQITDIETSPATVYTLVTGTISVTDDVSGTSS